MANDPGPNFRSELLSALDVLNPQIEGLDTLLQAGLSSEISTILQETISARRRRKSLIDAVIAALDTVLARLADLLADGYPALPGLMIDEILAAELKKEQDAIEAAIAIFAAKLRAAKIEISLGEATGKP